MEAERSVFSSLLGGVLLSLLLRLDVDGSRLTIVQAPPTCSTFIGWRIARFGADWMCVMGIAMAGVLVGMARFSAVWAAACNYILQIVATTSTM